MVNFGPLTAEIGSGVWGTLANFNGFCVLAALLHGGGRQPNYAALNTGRQLYSAGRPVRWALAHILVCKELSMFVDSAFNKINPYVLEHSRVYIDREVHGVRH